MNAIASLVVTVPMPKIANLQVVEPPVIRVTWSDGLRVGRTDVVDLSPMTDSFRLYRPIRDNEVLFRTVHLIEDGRILAWGDDDQIDMAAETIEDLAEETMTAEDLRAFLKSNNLTHAEAAALLDRSRRQIENYLSGNERIPRVFVMACFGLIARKRQLLRGPLAKISTANVRIQSVTTYTTARDRPVVRSSSGAWNDPRLQGRPVPALTSG